MPFENKKNSDDMVGNQFLTHYNIHRHPVFKVTRNIPEACWLLSQFDPGDQDDLFL